MKYIAALPSALAAVLLALVSFAALGQTHILSSLMGEAHLSQLANAVFLILTALYAVILWQLRCCFPGRVFSLCLYGLDIILLFGAAALLV